jgi:hypothetical protein
LKPLGLAGEELVHGMLCPGIRRTTVVVEDDDPVREHPRVHELETRHVGAVEIAVQVDERESLRG